MGNIYIVILKVLRKIYTKIVGKFVLSPLECEINPDKASEMIYNLLAEDKPCMIARYGSTELAAIINYLGVSSKSHSVWKYIRGEQPGWWWEPYIMKQMTRWSGFFPSTPETLSRFGRMMLEDTKQLDLLGSWVSDENFLKDKLKNVRKVHLRLLEPFWSKMPWSRILKGKKVLVVHPFADIIVEQYKRRMDLFEDSNILPEFESLQVVQAVQSLGGESNGFKDWFEALQWMEDEMDKVDYDICLIGCGAYGFSLAAHAKRMEKKAVHLGGALQLLFGIKGNRWEDPNYGVKEWGIPYGSYSSLMNENWVRPGAKNRPKNAAQVEGACYW